MKLGGLHLISQLIQQINWQVPLYEISNSKSGRDCEKSLPFQEHIDYLGFVGLVGVTQSFFFSRNGAAFHWRRRISFQIFWCEMLRNVTLLRWSYDISGFKRYVWFR